MLSSVWCVNEFDGRFIFKVTHLARDCSRIERIIVLLARNEKPEEYQEENEEVASYCGPIVLIKGVDIDVSSRLKDSRYNSHAEATRAIKLGNARILFGKYVKCSWGCNPTLGSNSNPLPDHSIRELPDIIAMDHATHERKLVLAKIDGGYSRIASAQSS
ncbi:hypothetical protein R3W88_032054 [Solanum pinnatisectum]|uniref:Uncharacterized protein n=1 Tax=Solanum pinnatisectum TaxID=50273 RepID=A0AAV9LRZ8_9SOLN|nr:hypothetical protein R3W88_032054 [Solanum pinnatisectum]